MRHYCDMMRVMAGVAAWAAGTVVAVSIAWFGANVVVRNAGVEPGMPVINAAVQPPSASPTPPASLKNPPSNWKNSPPASAK